MRYLQFDTSALLVSLAQCARQLQQRLAQSLLAVHRHQIGDDLLLVGDAHGEVPSSSESCSKRARNWLQGIFFKIVSFIAVAVSRREPNPDRINSPKISPALWMASRHSLPSGESMSSLICPLSMK